MNSIIRFFSKPIFQDKRFALFVWLIIPIITSIRALKHEHISNNYQIFKYTFIHSIEQVNLYLEYPSQYTDSNHYGPMFAMVIAPFTFLPDFWGNMFWCISMSMTLFVAIYYLPIPWKWKLFLYYIPFNELFNCGLHSQTTPMIAALIIGAFICLRKEKEIWAAFFIVFGFYIKLYGIAGLSLFFFSHNKTKFIAYLVMWSVILFVLPMIISSPSYVIQSYQDWYTSLVEKNQFNMTGGHSDYSAIGMIRKIFHQFDISVLSIVLPAFMIFLLQYIRIKQYEKLNYQIGILASTLMFIVLFSTGSENPSYLIASIGFGLWFCIQERPFNKSIIIFFISVWLITTLSTVDVLPKYIRKEIFRSYSLKALPSLAVWLVLAYQIIRNRGLIKTIPDEAK